MKKYFLFGVAIALTMGFGCAITDYSLITDNDVGGTVQTHGKAYIKQSSQIAFIYPDGTDNMVWHVDQAASGDRTLYTGNFHDSNYPAQSPFKDDLYCSPDWSGCSIVTASDPEVGDTDIYDYSFNPQCSGARTVSLLTATGRYYGECGRANANRMQNILNLANQMTPVTVNGTTWLKGVLNSSNLTYIIDNNNGASASFGPASDITVMVNNNRRATVDMSNPVIGQQLSRVHSWLVAHPSPTGEKVTAVLNGMSGEGHVKILPDNMQRYIQQHF